MSMLVEAEHLAGAAKHAALQRKKIQGNDAGDADDGGVSADHGVDAAISTAAPGVEDEGGHFTHGQGGTEHDRSAGGPTAEMVVIPWPERRREQSAMCARRAARGG